MRVRFTPEARSDLNAILQYIDERSPSGARNMKAAVKRTVSLVGDFPQAGRIAGELGVRVLSAGPYPNLIYEAWIVHIHHARRRPWQDELKDSEA